MRKHKITLAVLTLLTAATMALGWATQAPSSANSVTAGSRGGASTFGRESALAGSKGDKAEAGRDPALAGSDPRAFGRESS